MGSLYKERLDVDYFEEEPQIILEDFLHSNKFEGNDFYNFTDKELSLISEELLAKKFKEILKDLHIDTLTQLAKHSRSRRVRLLSNGLLTGIREIETKKKQLLESLKNKTVSELKALLSTLIDDKAWEKQYVFEEYRRKEQQYLSGLSTEELKRIMSSGYEGWSSKTVDTIISSRPEMRSDIDNWRDGYGLND